MGTDDRSDSDDGQCGQTENTVYRGSFDPRCDSASEALLVAVGELTDTDPAALPRLSEHVDPEALDAIFQPRPGGPPRDPDGRVVFTYVGYVVCLCSDGSLIIKDLDE
jgi:hypothetical protein